MKTAMQELIRQIGESGKDSFSSLEILLSANQLLEKEKEQISKSYDKGTIHSTRLGKFMDGNDYYTQTYNQ